MKSIKILFVTTSHNKMGDTSDKTGVWLEEFAAPYYVFKEAGAEVKVASTKGGRIPLDPKSQSIILATRQTKRFLKDEEAMILLSQSILLEEVIADDFDALFLPGGHGGLWDLDNNTFFTLLLEGFNRQQKPIGAVSHGIVGLLSLQNDKGEPWVKDRQLTCFSNSEETSTGSAGILPFLLEAKLRSLGALYSKGADYVDYVVTEGNIVTGQNPASSEEVAKRIVALVRQPIPAY